MSEPIFRYWVELRDLQNETTRKLRVRTVVRIHIPRKGHEARRPREEILVLEDAGASIEAKSFEDLADALRRKYPGLHFELSLRSERDLAAEARYADAINQLAKLIAQAAVSSVLRQNLDSDTASDD